MCSLTVSPVGWSKLPAEIEIRVAGVGSQNSELPHLRQNPRLVPGEERYQRSVPAYDPQVGWRTGGVGAYVGVHPLAKSAVADQHVLQRAMHLETDRATETAAGRAWTRLVVVRHRIHRGSS